MVIRVLATVLMCLASVVANSGYAFATASGLQDGVKPSPRQLLSNQAVTERAMQVARTDAPGAPGSDLRVQWEAGKLSLDVEGVPLSEVLRAVSHATGIRVTGAQNLSNRVSAHFAHMDLFQALKELLTRVNYVIAAGPSGSTPAQGTRVIILQGVAASGPPASLVTTATNAQEAPETDLQQPAANLPEPEAEPQESQMVAPQVAANEAADVESPTETNGQEVQEAGLQEADADLQEASEAGLQEAEMNLQEVSEAEQQESQLMVLQAAATGEDWDVLRAYLQDTDPTIQAAAFAALEAQGNAVANEDLRVNVQDTSQPTRLQALTLLVQNAEDDDQTVIAVLRDALQDPDPAFNAYAVQILAGRDNAEAMAALREAFHSTNSSTRLLILESVVHTEAGLPLLREALADADETVRDAAAALLKQAVTSTTGKL